MITTLQENYHSLTKTRSFEVCSGRLNVVFSERLNLKQCLMEKCNLNNFLPNILQLQSDTLI